MCKFVQFALYVYISHQNRFIERGNNFMKKNNKKGFTLVELLVVIAILAILATVSVVGYTSFTKKAKVSNAQNELTQARDIIIAEVLGDEDSTAKLCDHVSVKVSGTGYAVEFAASAGNKDDDFDNDLKTTFADLKSLKGTFAVTATTITYTYETDIIATWTLATNTIA